MYLNCSLFFFYLVIGIVTRNSTYGKNLLPPVQRVYSREQAVCRYDSAYEIFFNSIMLISKEKHRNSILLRCFSLLISIIELKKISYALSYLQTACSRE